MLGNILRFRLEWKQEQKRKPMWGEFHALNSCPLFNISWTQKIIIFMWSRVARNSFRWNIHSLSSRASAWDRWSIRSSQLRQVRANLCWREELEKWDIYMGSCGYGFRTGKVSILCKCQQVSTWQTPIANHLEEKIQILDEPHWVLAAWRANKSGWAWEKGVWREKELCRKGQQDAKTILTMVVFAACSQWLQKHSWKRRKTTSVDWKK